MKNSVTALLVASCLFGAGRAAAQVSTADRTQVEKAIRATADSFAESFKQRDAVAIAAQWTLDGVYVNEEGERFEGREAIQAEYETLFENCASDVELMIEIDSIRLINAQSAIEEGRAALVPQSPGEDRVMSRYTAVHVLQDGRWLMSHVRDTLVELPPDLGQLTDLNWLVGEWTATNNGVKLEVTYRWVENDQFLARSHTSTEGGKTTSTGLQIIGVDPTSEQITSWSFAGDGSLAVGRWLPTENGWLIDLDGVTSDGRESMATDILTPKDKDTLQWQSVERALGDDLLPDTPEVILKRK